MSLVDDMAVDPVPEAGTVLLRAKRFSGDTHSCRVAELSATSHEDLQWLYDWLGQVGSFSARDLNDPNIRAGLERLITAANLNRAAESAHNVRPAQAESLRLSRVLHDLRGTALQQVVGLASLRIEGAVEVDLLRAVAILARDHAKVLRHALIGLDEARRLVDADQRLHGVANLRNRLEVLLLSNSTGVVEVDFAAEWQGEFATTCSEFSTVLRQLYNLMGNAARHTVNQTVLIRVHPKPAVEPQSVRFVVANTLSAAEHLLLSPSVLAETWRGYTTTGSGLGLAATAALVGEAFGLNGGEQAVDLGFVGSRVTRYGYVAWFHWPVVVCGAAQQAVPADGAERRRWTATVRKRRSRE